MNKKEPKITQGELKMERYIQDLIRNKEFIGMMKRLKRLSNKMALEYKHKLMDKEYNEIILEYKKLRKRSSKFFDDDYFRLKNRISETYYLDNYQMIYIECLLNPDLFKNYLEIAKGNAQNDMCAILETDQILTFPNNDDNRNLIYLDPRTQLFFNAHPVGIFLNPKAAKRDVLDFIEKNWYRIENEYLFEKKLKYGKRKQSQKILDFIWSHKHLPSKVIKSKLDENFPKNDIVYYEINKIIQLERDKRLEKLT